MIDEKMIEERKAKSLLRHKKRAEKEKNIREGRQFFAKNKLPLLVSYPSDRPVAVYLTFMPVGKNKLRVAIALKSKKDNESFRKARGILGHRIRTTEAFDVVAEAHEGTFIAKDGGWRYKDIYAALNAVTPVEMMMQESCPEWMKRILMAGSHPLEFQDYRIYRHIDASWPWEAVRVAQRYYERSWPAPVK
jgi:hypothetical protein